MRMNRSLGLSLTLSIWVVVAGWVVPVAADEASADKAAVARGNRAFALDLYAHCARTGQPHLLAVGRPSALTLPPAAAGRSSDGQDVAL
jgi:hypothetical protein